MYKFDLNNESQYVEQVTPFDENANQWFGDFLSKRERTNHTNMPRASKIVEFWYRWGEFHYKNRSHGKLPEFIHDLVIDLGEPFCFACRIRYL